MTGWYQYFLPAVIVLWALSTERDRPAAKVVLVATLASHFLVTPCTQQIVEAWKLIFPLSVELLTIAALYCWAKGRTGYGQIVCLSVAGLAHFLCYVDIRCNTDAIYSRYELVLMLVATAQVVVFHDTIGHSLHQFAAWLGVVRASHLSSFCLGNFRDPVLREPGTPGI